MNLSLIFEYLEQLETWKNQAVEREFDYKQRWEAMMANRNIIQRDFYAMLKERDDLKTELAQVRESLETMTEGRNLALHDLRRARRLDPDAQHWKHVAEDWDVRLQGAMAELSHVEVERDSLQGELSLTDASRDSWKILAEARRRELEKRPLLVHLSKLLVDTEADRDTWHEEFDKVQLELRQTERERDALEGVAEEHRKEELKPFRVSVARCARCQGTHHDLVFERLENATPPWLWWALCPETNSPVMLEEREE